MFKKWKLLTSGFSSNMYKELGSPHSCPTKGKAEQTENQWFSLIHWRTVCRENHHLIVWRDRWIRVTAEISLLEGEDVWVTTVKNTSVAWINDKLLEDEYRLAWEWETSSRLQSYGGPTLSWVFASKTPTRFWR